MKTNIGHLDAAAGVDRPDQDRARAPPRDASAQPPLRGAEPEARPREHARSSSTPRCTPWPAARDEPRRAGVSSLGVGRHECPCRPRGGAARRARRRRAREQLLVLSARSAAALDRAAERLAAHLEADTPRRRSPTSPTRSRRPPSRSPIGARRRREPRRGGRAPRARRAGERVAGAGRTAASAAVAFLFPGQGAQYAGTWGAASTRASRSSGRRSTSAARCCAAAPRLDLRDAPLSEPTTTRRARGASSTQTALTQPALFVIELRHGEALDELGRRARRDDRPQPRRLRRGLPRRRLLARRRAGARCAPRGG